MTHAEIAQPWPGRTWKIFNPTVLLCIAGVGLPNALFLGGMAFGIGTPPRPAFVFAYAVLAWFARTTSPFIIVPSYLCILAYDLIYTVARSFNLSPRTLGLAANLIVELKLFESPLYLALIAGVAALIIANLAFLIFMRKRFRDGNTYVLIGLAVAYLGLDYAANASPHYQFGTLYGANKPMESAMVDSGFRETILTRNPNNVLVVMVESLGMLADQDDQELMLRTFKDPELLKRYDVTLGSTTYYGSTTAAEMRELCNSRVSFEVMKENPDDIVCLPRILRDRGYRTTSLHNFTGIFFDRPAWYPNLGLENRMFGEQLHGTGYRNCGVAFRGPCDIELVPLVEKQLRDTSKPNFFYWLTLSTHTPTAPAEGTPRLDCYPDGGVVGNREVCFMIELWIDLFEGLAAMTAQIPPTEILIIGDHAPPLWSKKARAQFIAGKVPWIRLTPRNSLVASQPD